MPAPTDIEQYLLELINDARLDPMGNAARYIQSYAPLRSSDPDIQNALDFFSVNGAALLTAYAALTPVKPLAWNSNIAAAATAHSQAMITNDDQSHQLPGESSLGARITAAGYSNWNGVAENIYAYATNPLFAHAGFMVDWGFGPDGMQNPAGHRINIMAASYREIGISAITENNPATAVGTLVVTEDFGFRSNGPQVFILGVAYADNDHNAFYSIGEGNATLSIAVNTRGVVQNGTAGTSGGYALGTNAGASTITFTNGGLLQPVTATGNFAAGTNVKIDIVDGTTLLTSESVTVDGPVQQIKGLGVIGLHLTGGTGTQAITGTKAGDFLDGGAGNDVLSGGRGNDSLTGGAGADLFYFAASDLSGGAVDTVTDGGTSTSDFIRIDGAQYYQITVAANGGGARISHDGGAAFIDVLGAGSNPIIVGTSPTVVDYTTLTSAARANLQISVFDWANSVAYSKYTEIYTAAGLLQRQFGTYDGSGGSWDFLYDVANAESAYATRFDYFNQAGQITQTVGTYDAPMSGATRYIVSYDPAGTQPYVTTTAYFNAAGSPLQVQSFYDAGGSGITVFDPANTQAYDNYTTFYDAQGRADQANGVYDGINGTYYVNFDERNEYAWDSLTVLYNQAGTVTQQWYTFGDGSIQYL